ncbi:hypothetical protein [Acetobacter senegalensis]|uniref:hypothetical protein n=1 Tax=Acetobacter senegalensis TaxID=446692 RepID=UPI00264ED613|nr:hypothetical protein [Acetobacter senegalensis]MDN7355139.1 hypothetical protein [Acetobacter senegalensis]
MRCRHKSGLCRPGYSLPGATLFSADIGLGVSALGCQPVRDAVAVGPVRMVSQTGRLS